WRSKPALLRATTVNSLLNAPVQVTLHSFQGGCIMSRVRYAVVLLFACLLPVGAQVSAVSQISGIVQDPTGAAIPNARVTITNVDTSAARTIETGADGSYVVTNLVVGPYRLQVTKDGFTTYNQSGIVLQVNTN